jgi:hypothetical protein
MGSYEHDNTRNVGMQPERMATEQEITDRDWAWFMWHPKVIAFARALYPDEVIEDTIIAEAPADAVILTVVQRMQFRMWGTYVPGIMLSSQSYTDRKTWDSGVGKRRGSRAIPHLIARDGAVISTLSIGSNRWQLAEPGPTEDGGAA